MKKFNESHCPLDDDIAFWVDVKIMPNYKKWESLEYTKELKSKMFEEYSTTETAPHGTRKPTSLDERRDYTAKAKLRKENVIKLRKFRKAKYERKPCAELLYGLARIPGTSTMFMYEVESKNLWSNNQRQTRHKGKAICRNYMEVLA